jgi:hypothetical protein
MHLGPDRLNNANINIRKSHNFGSMRTRRTVDLLVDSDGPGRSARWIPIQIERGRSGAPVTRPDVDGTRRWAERRMYSWRATGSWSWRLLKGGGDLELGLRSDLFRLGLDIETERIISGIIFESYCEWKSLRSYPFFMMDKILVEIYVLRRGLFFRKFGGNFSKSFAHEKK